MPRFPGTSPQAGAIAASTFTAFGAELQRRQRDPDFVALHIGESALLPPAASRGIDLDELAIHRYGPVAGLTGLRAAQAEDLGRLGLPCDVEQTFATAGATGALDVAVSAALQPGDEVLVCAPTWPLILGILRRHGCRPVQVPVDPGGWLADDGGDLGERLAAALSERTAAVYLCNPNNPAGFVYGAAASAAIAELAARHDLWVFLDAVYADLIFEGGDPLALARLCPDRTFVVTSFSKSYSLAGHRVGGLAAPPAAAPLIPRLLTHSTYHASVLAQRMALAALTAPDAAEERARRLEAARAGARLALDILRSVPGLRVVGPPSAGTFLFLDLAAVCADEAALLELLQRCLAAGVSLAPGGAFGEAFRRCARLCFTATDLAALEVGVRRLAEVVGNAGRST